MCCGLNSIGIGSGGGVGKATAEWMINGHINEDIFNYDIKRFQKFHSDLGFIKERITESLGDLYGMHWPFKQHKTSRNIKTLPHHENLKSFGACFGVSGGYERPMWFALDGEKLSMNIVIIIKTGTHQPNMKLAIQQKMLDYLI